MPEPSLPALSDLTAEEKASRAASFGTVADHYERFRPGPIPEVVDWVVPVHVERVVDLGAGTGALTRRLVGRAEHVVAVEPDDRMRTVLSEQLPAVDAVKGYGESIPLPDGSADAVLASSSWHWMDPARAVPEVARVLRPGAPLCAMWTGPDDDSPFIVQARALLGGNGSDEAHVLMTDVDRRPSVLEIPPGMPFSTPEHGEFRWNIALTADDLIGLLGTMSMFILMAEDERERVFGEARRLLKELLGVEGEVAVDVGFKVDAWRAYLKD